jgi:hypothetical protein
MAARTVEVAQFHLVEGTDEKAFLEAADAMQSEFLSNASGFIHRELIKGQYDEWMDIVHWNSLPEAEEAARQATNHPVCLRFFGMIDEMSMTIMYLQQIREY